jgi:glycosyltransferase involved in cell wall biosynthesis/multidrug transporter EmrE-like cation transporter
MRTLVVSSYPPRHCGIGAYARDQVVELRAAGEEVVVLSPPDGDGDVRAPFLGGAAFRKAARIGGRFGRIVVHFQPALYYRPRAALSKVVTSLSLLWLVLRRPRVDLVVHEADRPVRWRPDYVILGLAFRAAGTVSFHTRAEQAALERDYRGRVRGALIPHRVRPVEPGARAEARAALGIPAGAGPVFVCPGFLQPSKGLERAVAAFAAGPGTGLLYVVGSVRDPSPEADTYVHGLRALCERTPGVTLVERWVDDGEFDRWIRAADAVVLPYRRAWSSGVLARAHALGTPAVVADVGGLAEQAGDGDIVVESDADLFAALARPDLVRPPRAAKRSNAPAIAGGAVKRTDHAHEWDPYYPPEPTEPPTRKGHLMLLGLIIFSVGLAALAQLTLKHGMNQVSDYGARPLELGQPVATLQRIASNLSVWVGLATFAASAMVWLVILSRASLSFAYPFAALTYVLILLFDRFVLHDQVPLLRWGGVALIIGGILLISRTPHS